MSTELIRSVRIDHEKEKVYLESVSNNTFPRDWREIECPSFSEGYRKGGQQEVDKRMLETLLECAVIVSNDPSMTPYRYALGSARAIKTFENHGYVLEPSEKSFSCCSKSLLPLVRFRGEDYEVLLDELVEMCRQSRVRREKRRGKRMLQEAAWAVTS